MNKDEGGRPATKEDVEKLSMKLEATREELLARMAPKEELQALREETKEELQAIREEMATKEELQVIREEMATKKELGKLQDSVNRLAIKVAQNSERMVTKDEFRSSQDQMFTALDQILGIVKRNDEERLFTVEWLKRHDRELEEHAAVLEKHTVEIETLGAFLPTGTDASS